MLRNLKRYFSNNFFFFYKQDKSPTQRYPFSNKIQSTKKNLEISHADNSSSKKEKKKNDHPNSKHGSRPLSHASLPPTQRGVHLVYSLLRSHAV